MFAWGDNSIGKLGIDEPRIQKVPRATLVQGVEGGVTQVSCGGDHTLCLTKAGRVYQLGQYSTYSKKGQPAKHGTLYKPKLVEGLPKDLMAT